MNANKNWGKRRRKIGNRKEKKEDEGEVKLMNLFYDSIKAS